MSVCLRVWCVCACDLSSIRSHHADTLDTLPVHSAPFQWCCHFFLSTVHIIPSLPLFICCLPKSSALLHQFTTCDSCGRHLQRQLLSAQRISPFFCLFSLFFSCQTLHSFSSPLPLPLRHTQTGLPVLSSRSDPFASTLSCLDQKERLTVNVRGCTSANNNI